MESRRPALVAADDHPPSPPPPPTPYPDTPLPLTPLPDSPAPDTPPPPALRPAAHLRSVQVDPARPRTRAAARHTPHITKPGTTRTRHTARSRSNTPPISKTPAAVPTPAPAPARPATRRSAAAAVSKQPVDHDKPKHNLRGNHLSNSPPTLHDDDDEAPTHKPLSVGGMPTASASHAKEQPNHASPLPDDPILPSAPASAPNPPRSTSPPRTDSAAESNPHLPPPSDPSNTRPAASSPPPPLSDPPVSPPSTRAAADPRNNLPPSPLRTRARAEAGTLVTSTTTPDTGESRPHAASVASPSGEGKGVAVSLSPPMTRASRSASAEPKMLSPLKLKTRSAAAAIAKPMPRLGVDVPGVKAGRSVVEGKVMPKKGVDALAVRKSVEKDAQMTDVDDERGDHVDEGQKEVEAMAVDTPEKETPEMSLKDLEKEKEVPDSDEDDMEKPSADEVKPANAVSDDDDDADRKPELVPDADDAAPKIPSEDVAPVDEPAEPAPKSSTFSVFNFSLKPVVEVRKQQQKVINVMDDDEDSEQNDDRAKDPDAEPEPDQDQEEEEDPEPVPQLEPEAPPLPEHAPMHSYSTRRRTRSQAHSPRRTRRRHSEPVAARPAPKSTPKKKSKHPKKGDRLRVLWHVDNIYYQGTVDSVLTFKGKRFYDITYDSMEREYYVDLSVRKWRFAVARDGQEEEEDPPIEEKLDEEEEDELDEDQFPKRGDKVMIMWHVDEKYYPGVIKDVLRVGKRLFHDVSYDKGDLEFFLDLKVRKWRYQNPEGEEEVDEITPAPPKARAKPKSRGKQKVTTRRSSRRLSGSDSVMSVDSPSPVGRRGRRDQASLSPVETAQKSRAKARQSLPARFADPLELHEPDFSPPLSPLGPLSPPSPQSPIAPELPPAPQSGRDGPGSSIGQLPDPGSFDNDILDLMVDDVDAPLQTDSFEQRKRPRSQDINAIAADLVERKRQKAAETPTGETEPAQTPTDKPSTTPAEEKPAPSVPEQEGPETEHLQSDPHVAERPIPVRPALAASEPLRSAPDRSAPRRATAKGPPPGSKLAVRPMAVRPIAARPAAARPVPSRPVPEPKPPVPVSRAAPALERRAIEYVDHAEDRRRPKTRVSDIVSVAGLVAKKWANEECSAITQNVHYIKRQVSALKKLQVTTERLRRKRARQIEREEQEEEEAERRQLPNTVDVAETYDLDAHLGHLKVEIVDQLQRYRRTVEEREKNLKRQFAIIKNQAVAQNAQLVESARIVRSLEHNAIQELEQIAPKLKKVVPLPPPSARSDPLSSPSAIMRTFPPFGYAEDEAARSLHQKVTDLSGKSDFLEEEVKRLQARERQLMKEKEQAMEDLTKAKYGKDVALAADRKASSSSRREIAAATPPVAKEVKGKASPARLGNPAPSKPVGITKKRAVIPKGGVSKDGVRHSGRANRKTLPRGTSKYKPPPPLPKAAPAPPQPTKREIAPVKKMEVEAAIPSVAEQERTVKNFPIQLGKQMDKQAAELLALIATVWLLQDEGRSEPPKKPGEKQDKWVEGCVKGALRHAVTYLTTCSGIMSAKKSLLQEVEGETVKTGWVSADDDAGIEEARSNYKLWEPTLAQEEWLVEKRVLCGLNLSIRTAMTSTTAGRFSATIMYAKEIARKALADFDTIMAPSLHGKPLPHVGGGTQSAAPTVASGTPGVAGRSYLPSTQAAPNQLSTKPGVIATGSQGTPKPAAVNPTNAPVRLAKPTTGQLPVLPALLAPSSAPVPGPPKAVAIAPKPGPHVAGSTPITGPSAPVPPAATAGKDARAPRPSSQAQATASAADTAGASIAGGRSAAPASAVAVVSAPPVTAPSQTTAPGSRAPTSNATDGKTASPAEAKAAPNAQAATEPTTKKKGIPSSDKKMQPASAGQLSTEAKPQSNTPKVNPAGPAQSVTPTEDANGNGPSSEPSAAAKVQPTATPIKAAKGSRPGAKDGQNSGAAPASSGPAAPGILPTQLTDAPAESRPRQADQTAVPSGEKKASAGSRVEQSNSQKEPTPSGKTRGSTGGSRTSSRTSSGSKNQTSKSRGAGKRESVKSQSPATPSQDQGNGAENQPTSARVNRVYRTKGKASAATAPNMQSPMQDEAPQPTAQMRLPAVPFRKAAPSMRQDILIGASEGPDTVQLGTGQGSGGQNLQALEPMDVSPAKVREIPVPRVGGTVPSPKPPKQGIAQKELRSTMVAGDRPSTLLRSSPSPPAKTRRTNQSMLFQAAAKKKQVGFKSIPQPPKRRAGMGSNAVSPFEPRGSPNAHFASSFDPSQPPQPSQQFDYRRQGGSQELNAPLGSSTVHEPYRERRSESEPTQGNMFASGESGYGTYGSGVNERNTDLSQLDLMNPPTPSSFPGLEGYIMNDSTVGLKRLPNEERESLPATPSDFANDRTYAGPGLNSPINFERNYASPDPFAGNRNPYSGGVGTGTGAYQQNAGGSSSALGHIMNPQQQQLQLQQQQQQQQLARSEPYIRDATYGSYQAPRGQPFQPRGPFQRGPR